MVSIGVKGVEYMVIIGVALVNWANDTYNYRKSVVMGLVVGAVDDEALLYIELFLGLVEYGGVLFYFVVGAFGVVHDFLG